MYEYFLGIDASKGYSDFVMLNAKKQLVIENFQLDDTFEGHAWLYELLWRIIRAGDRWIVINLKDINGGHWL